MKIDRSKLCGCKRWCPNDLRVRASAAATRSNPFPEIEFVPVDLKDADAVVEEPVLVFVGVEVVETLEVLAHEYLVLDDVVAVEWELKLENVGIKAPGTAVEVDKPVAEDSDETVEGLEFVIESLGVEAV